MTVMATKADYATQVAIRQRDNSFRDKLDRYVAGHPNDPDRRRKAMIALTAKMARVAHVVIKTGTEYRPGGHQMEGPLSVQP